MMFIEGEGTEGIRHLGREIWFRYSVFTIFSDLKYFQDIKNHKTIETDTGTKILAQPFIFSTSDAPNCLMD